MSVLLALGSLHESLLCTSSLLPAMLRSSLRGQSFFFFFKKKSKIYILVLDHSLAQSTNVNQLTSKEIFLPLMRHFPLG
jgi:hypothetical protein